MARPTLFTPARAALIVRTIRETGCSLGAAARVAGIGESTLRDWRKRGAQELTQTAEPIEAEQDGEPQSYGQFVIALEQALAGIESRLTKCLVEAASKDWRAAAWWLERRRPEVYADGRETAEENVDAPPSTKLQLVDAKVAADVIRERLQQRERGITDGAP